MIKPCSPWHPINVGLLLLGASALALAARATSRGSASKRGSRSPRPSDLFGMMIEREAEGVQQAQRRQQKQEAQHKQQKQQAQQRVAPHAPSAQSMVEKLHIAPQQAGQIREKMKSGHIVPALQMARQAMGGYDVRVLRGKEDQPMRFTGLEFVDTADAWRDTLIYDYGRNRFIIAPWGDTVDANKERF